MRATPSPRADSRQAPSIPRGADITTTPGVATAAAKRSRFLFIDNLRVLLISLVVVQHLSVTYGAIGFWYYRDPATDTFTAAFLTMWNGPGQAAGMGLFFLISAYFTPGAYDRKGGKAFLRDRLIRLGVPLLLYELLIDPLVVYLARGLPSSYWSFYGNYLLAWQGISGPVWFIAVLLLFTLVYAAWRALTRNRPRANEQAVPLPSYGAILAFVVALGMVTFAVRIWWPVTRVLQPLGVSAGYLPQYISMFVLGLIAYRGNWFLKLSTRTARDWLLVALLVSLGWLAIVIPAIAGSAGRSGNEVGPSMAGGVHWLALTYSLWESFVLVGASIGLLVHFRERLNRQGRLAEELAADAYTVYLVHPVVLVGFSYAFHTVALYPLLKFVIAVLIGLPLCYLVSGCVRRIPLLNKVL